MAVLRECIGLDIGTHSIRIAEVALGTEGVEIKQLVEARVETEPGQTEEDRQAGIISQVNDLLKENGIKTRYAVFCVPGQSVFVRRLRLPVTSPERLARIIHYEAREQIPFPLEKTKLEYQIFDAAEEDEELEVVLVAIKRDFVANYMRMVTKSGLKPLAISVSSLALHNFHELNGRRKSLQENAEKPKGGKKKGKGLKLRFGKGKKDEEPREEPEEEEDPYDSMELDEIQAQVNLGATIMDLAIPQTGAQHLIGFTRSVPVAGAQMDRAIRTKLVLDTIQEANRIKEQETAILASDFELASDTDMMNMEASQAATAVADGIISELRRSLDFFISQPDGVAVDSIVLSGGLSRMRFLSNYIEEKMGIPVEAAEIKNEQISIAEELAESVTSFAIPLGLAYQGLGLSQIDIDFLPQDVKNIRAFKDKRASIFACAALLLVTVGLSGFAGNKYMDNNRQLAVQYEAELAKTKAQRDKVNSAQDANKALDVQYRALIASKGHNHHWMDFMRAFLLSRPPDILVDSLEMSNSGHVVVRGRTPRTESVSEFLERLSDEKNEKWIASADLETIEQMSRDPFGRFESPVIPFEIRITTPARKGRLRPIKRALGAATTGRRRGAVTGDLFAAEGGAALEQLKALGFIK